MTFPTRCGNPWDSPYGLIDTPLNILSNKITAITGRDEPKDIFDIYMLAKSYHFNWIVVFAEAKKKATLNEIDVEQRIKSFPVTMLQHVNWLFHPVEPEVFNEGMLEIANDFLLGRDNSLSSGTTLFRLKMPHPVQIGGNQVHCGMDMSLFRLGAVGRRL